MIRLKWQDDPELVVVVRHLHGQYFGAKLALG